MTPQFVPEIRNTSLGQMISSRPFTDNYADLAEANIGEYYVLTDPSTPIRAGKDLKQIVDLDDAGQLGTVLQFGHPMQVIESFNDRYAVRLLTHGKDPATEDFGLGIEKHKFRTLINEEIAIQYADHPSAVVVERDGITVRDVHTGTTHRLLFGSRVHDLNGSTFSLGLDKFRRTYDIVEGIDALGEAYYNLA